MKAHFVALAHYNAWANARLYADASALPDEAVHREVGVYFGSLFDTLTHILNVDCAWAHLINGGKLDDMPAVVAPADLIMLRYARVDEDERLIGHLVATDDAWLQGPVTFESKLPSWVGKSWHGTRAGILTHLFNHQTHHRGQAHTALSLLGVEPQALDILVKGFLDQNPSEFGEMPA